VIFSIAAYIGATTKNLSINGTVWIIASAAGLATILVAFQYSLLLWILKRWASRNGTQLTDVIRAMYEWHWPETKIQWNENFKKEFEEEVMLRNKELDRP